MKEKMSSIKAWTILSGLFLVIPFIVIGYVKFWSIAYNLFF